MYKPPPSELYPTSLHSVPAPAIYAGDFNCQHTDWGYKHTTKDRETLSDWASSDPVPKQCYCMTQRSPPSVFSARWNTYTNQDLAFAVGRSCDPKPERRIIDRFPRSHHRPSIIKVPSLVHPIAGKPVKRWNFRKANCSDTPVLYSLVYGNWLAAPPSGLVAMYLALYNKVSL